MKNIIVTTVLILLISFGIVTAEKELPPTPPVDYTPDKGGCWITTMMTGR